MELKINDEQDMYHDAAKRLAILLSGASYDVFALDLYYHKACCTYEYDQKNSNAPAVERECATVMSNFFRLFESKVIKDKEAYLLTELLEDVKEIKGLMSHQAINIYFEEYV